MTVTSKGIVLAGGSGSRLYPITKGVSKQLLPIYNKPMIYYPISTLMLANIRDILVISTPEDISHYERLLGNGSNLGLRIEYAIQERPEGLAQAFIVGERFIGGDNVALVLGDNIFYGHKFHEYLKKASFNEKGATIFGSCVKDPERFGVIEFASDNRVISIEEKPNFPKSKYAVTGLYFYDSDVIEISKSLQPSIRGELEITDINNIYLKNKNLKVQILEEDFIWLDTGTNDSLIEASRFVQNFELNHKSKIACLEEISFKKEWITRDLLLKKAHELRNSEYGMYLNSLAAVK